MASGCPRKAKNADYCFISCKRAVELFLAEAKMAANYNWAPAGIVPTPAHT